MKVEKYFIVRCEKILGGYNRPVYYGMYGFASTSPSPQQIDKLGFESSKAALDRLAYLSEIEGPESVHGCYVVELQAFFDENIVYITQSHIGDR